MSLTMFGQPQIPTHLDFDVTDFKIVKEGVVEVGAVLEILDLNESFTLRFDFEGEGTEWRNICDDAQREYKVHFDAEGIGPSPHEDYHLGEFTSNLQPGKYSYVVKHNVPDGIPTEGIYRLSAMVTLPKWEGVLGFAEGLVIQVSELEE